MEVEKHVTVTENSMVDSILQELNHRISTTVPLPGITHKWKNQTDAQPPIVRATLFTMYER